MNDILILLGQVIGQLDNKFIICVLNYADDKPLLVALDQHAVHERIRLEAVEKVHLTPEKTLRSWSISPPLPVLLSHSDVRIIDSHQDVLNRYGFTFARVSCPYDVLILPKFLSMFIFQFYQTKMFEKWKKTF